MNKSKKDMLIEKQTVKLNEKLNYFNLTTNIDQCKSTMKELFKDTDTIVYRDLNNKTDSKFKAFIAYNDGLVNSIIINDNVVHPIFSATIPNGEETIDYFCYQIIAINEITKTNDIKTIIESITYGDTILFLDGYSEVLILNTKGFETRSISEPDTEKNIQGPKEGFTEALLKNLSLVRRKLRTNTLKMKYHTIGTLSQTKVCICYIDGIVDKKILKSLEKRLSKIHIDAILDSNYISELIKDSKLSPFSTIGYTERPDVVVGKLLEGRIAVFIDGTPVVLTVPYLFVENFQNSEDYYMNFYYASFSRLLRILGFIITTIIPSFYISIVGYHFEMLPSSLLMNFAIEQQGVPLSASLELFGLLIIFDILRETGVRMPSSIGQALSIVGALVLGEAAVGAKLVASPTIIIVAITGITNLLVPKLSSPVMVVRYSILLLASLFGSIGLTFGIAFFMGHILSLKSFGIPYALSDKKLTLQNNKDTIARLPWWQMKLRDKNFTFNLTRLKIKKGK